MHLLLLLELQLQSNTCLFLCFAPQQSSINNNNVDTSSINICVPACNRNRTMLNTIPVQLKPSTTCMCGRWRGGMYVRTMERGEGHSVGNVLDSRYCVGNVLDRGRVAVVDVDRRPASTSLRVQLEHHSSSNYNRNVIRQWQ